MSTPMDRFPEPLKFHPEWWIDPVPWWFLTHLDKNILRELTVISIERQKETLAAQTKALDRAMAAIGKAR